MRIFRPIIVLLIISCSLIFSTVRNSSLYHRILSREMPPRTVVIKDLRAAEVRSYFAAYTEYTFYVHRLGNHQEASHLASLFANNPSVESCSVGPAHQQLQTIKLKLRDTKRRRWFKGIFREAGLETIKVNDGPVINMLEL